MKIKMLLLSWVFIPYLGLAKTVTVDSVPSLYCGPKEIKALLKDKLNLNVIKARVSERAGHVDYFVLTIDSDNKVNEKAIVDAVDAGCMHANYKAKVSSKKAPQHHYWPVSVTNQTGKKVLFFTRYNDWLNTDTEGDLLQAAVPQNLTKPFKTDNQGMRIKINAKAVDKKILNLWFNAYPNNKNLTTMVLHFYTLPRTLLCKVGIVSQVKGKEARVLAVVKNDNRCQATWDKQWYATEGDGVHITPIHLKLTNQTFVQ